MGKVDDGWGRVDWGVEAPWGRSGREGEVGVCVGVGEHNGEGGGRRGV